MRLHFYQVSKSSRPYLLACLLTWWAEGLGRGLETRRSMAKVAKVAEMSLPTYQATLGIETGTDVIIKKGHSRAHPEYCNEYKQWASLWRRRSLQMRITLWLRISYPLVGHYQRSIRHHLTKMSFGWRSSPFDILTILASSADCERMFNELGDLLETRRMKMRPQIISAIQCSKA
jgi:hAT family C-terminal dimerisation region